MYLVDGAASDCARSSRFEGREGESKMTQKDADARAAALGLSAWVTQVIAVGRKSRIVDLYCVGFASIEVPLAEAESWEEAFEKVSHIIR
jgi:hypothetical protein